MKMRHAQRRRRVLPILLWVVFVVGGLLSGLFAWGNLSVPQDAPAWRLTLHRISSAGGPWVAVVVSLAAVLGKAFLPRARWHTVHDILTSFRGTLFQREVTAGAAEHEHRITLFKKVRWRWAFCKWPWSGWLIPVERSGEATQSSTSAFKAPDNPREATGIAGLSFYVENFLSRESLPDLSAADPTEGNFTAYADATKCAVEYVRRRRPLARSFMAFRIVVNGKAWGSLVIDSVSPKPKEGYQAKLLYGLLQQTLGIVLG